MSAPVCLRLVTASLILALPVRAPHKEKPLSNVVLSAIRTMSGGIANTTDSGHMKR
jgi:hypothetical protein